MSLNNIKQRIRDYSTTLTQANSGLSSDTSFLNDAMVDGAKDVVKFVYDGMFWYCTSYSRNSS